MIADCVKEHQSNIIRIDRQFVPGTREEDGDVCY
jgi:DNA-directed RNA polymerase II subunit RPB2